MQRLLYYTTRADDFYSFERLFMTPFCTIKKIVLITLLSATIPTYAEITTESERKQLFLSMAIGAVHGSINGMLPPHKDKALLDNPETATCMAFNALDVYLTKKLIPENNDKFLAQKIGHGLSQMTTESLISSYKSGELQIKINTNVVLAFLSLFNY